MAAKYQLISANTTEEMVNRIRVMATQGDVAVAHANKRFNILSKARL